MTQLVNNFEGGTNGVALTGGVSGNTGGASGNYLTEANVTADGILQFTNVQVAAGSLACRMATRTSTGALDLTWKSGARGNIADDYVRFYFWTDNKTTGAQARNIVRWFTAGSSLGGILMGNDRLYATDNTNAINAAYSTTLLAASQWVRIEAHMHPRTDGTGSLQVKLWLTASSSGAADWDFTVSGLTHANTFTDQIILGNAGPGANWPTSTGFVYFDEIVTGATSWVGPVSTATTTVMPTSAVSSPVMAAFAAELVLSPDVSAVSTASSPSATTTGINPNSRLPGVRAAATAAGKAGGFFSTASWKGIVVDGGSGLLPQVNWEADLGAPTNNGRSWTSIATLVRNCSFARSGRSDELQRTSPGTLTMTLDNRADAATNLGLKKAQWIRVTALWAGVQYPLWWGLITSLTRQWPSAGRDATLTVQAADALYLLRIAQMRVWPVDTQAVPLTSFPQERADQRISRILSSFMRGGGGLVGSLDPQTDTLDAVPDVSATTDALSIALAVEGSDNGLLIADPAGTVSYQGRQWRMLNAASSVLTVGEAGGVEVSYDDSVSYEDDDSRLTNIVNVTPLGASTPQSAEDTASEALYWGRHNQTVDRSLLSSDANLALAAAQYLVTRYKDPPPRIPALTLNMVTVPSAQKPTVLSLTNSQRVTWKRAAAAAIQTDGFVEQIQHTLAPGSSWTTTLQLSPATLEAAWILGDATNGQLGTSTALAY